MAIVRRKVELPADSFCAEGGARTGEEFGVVPKLDLSVPISGFEMLCIGPLIV